MNGGCVCDHVTASWTHQVDPGFGVRPRAKLEVALLRVVGEVLHVHGTRHPHLHHRQPGGVTVVVEDHVFIALTTPVETRVWFDAGRDTCDDSVQQTAVHVLTNTHVLA